MDHVCHIVVLLLATSSLAQKGEEVEEIYPGNYFILAPDTVRPGLPFTLSVNIRVATEPVAVTAVIKELDSEDVVVEESRSFTVGVLDTLDINIPQNMRFPTSSYQLVVSGLGGGLNFTEEKNLKFNVKHLALFIQTDKAIYKPGQTVHFRVLAVYPDMMPYLGLFDIEVKDPDDNIIQLWSDLKNETYGVISQSMVMSTEPVLGDWTIKAIAEGQEQVQTITIDEYVLPKFDVTVVLPPYISGEDTQLNIQVDSKYTYGKSVKGSAKITIQFQFYSNSIIRSLQLNGPADIVVSMVDLLSLFKTDNTWSDNINNQMEIAVSAVVTEDLTGLTQDGAAVVKYYTKPIKVEALPVTSTVFKPGLTYTAFLSVTHQDGSMLSSNERGHSLLVVFQESSDTVGGKRIQQAYSIPTSGVVEATYEVPSTITSLQMSVYYYRPSTRELGSYFDGYYNSYLSVMDSPSDSYIQIYLETSKVSVGEDVSLTVRTTEIPAKLSYVVIVQGNIVLYDSVDDLTGTLNSITFATEPFMAPKAKVIVSFIRSDAEVVLDSVEFQVDGVFRNQVSVSYNRDTSEPGENITFDVEASSNSFVGILAVDQSVLILKSGNDITQEQVIDAVSSFDSGGNSGGYPYPSDIQYRKKRSSIWYPNYSRGTSAGRILADAGLLVFTDALLYGVVNNYFYGNNVPVFYDFGIAEDAQAMPAVAKSAPTSVGNSEPIKIRKEFPETWLWSEHITDANGKLTVNTQVPDTITSWLGSAFSVSLSDGLGVSEAPAKTTVFKPFFISLNLPYSIIRGETLVLQATVFNYFDKKVEATVSLEKSDQYEAIILEGNGVEKLSSKDQRQKVNVPAGTGVSVFFPIALKKLGMIDITVVARSSMAGDAVRRQLLVEPEGVAHSASQSRLFNEKSATEFEERFTINVPPADKLVSGSVRVLLSITGDIMGPTMNNLDSLLKMPYGCGEQNMMNFAPDVFVYKYLTVTEQSSPVIKEKAFKFMLSGYQRELTYKHSDGSFSAFGKSDNSGSIWLTSFVVKSFVGAQQFITIDTKIIEKAVQFIVSLQTRDGSFTEPGRIVDRGIEGGVTPGATLTAYITIALQGVLNSYNGTSDITISTLRSTITKAQGYLEKRFSTIQNDVYALSLATYALALTESENVSTFLDALDNLAITNGGQRHWSAAPDAKEGGEDDYYRSYHGPSSNDVEMTAYALLAYLQLDDVPGAASIAKWMTHQRNAFGGYGSTQDTVIGLQALTEFALHFRETDPHVDLTVSLSNDPTYSHDLTIDAENSIILQQLELPVQSGDVIVTGSGQGTCLMTLAVFYNVNKIKDRLSFLYTITMTDIDYNNIKIEACGRYMGEHPTTSMCLMDIGIPSGFAADHDHLSEVQRNHPLVEKFETVQQAVYFYFQEIPKTYDTCVTVLASRSNVVANVQPKYARLYDYYNPAEQVVIEYSSDILRGSTICDVCPDCTGCSGSGSRSTLVSFALLVITLVIAVFVGKL